MWTRREFAKLALAGAAGSVCGNAVTNSIVSAAERPNSVIDGVQIGTITYSYRSMPDQSGEATLRLGSMTAFDKAFAASKANMANVDFGHYVAGGNVGGSTVQFLQKFHDRIASFHLKDRTTPEHGAKNLPWGTGDTPVKEILQMMKKNKWTMPATIELEYDVPAGSDAVKEVAMCLQYCKAALNS